MLARAHTFTIDGLQVRPVAVEVDIRPGLACFSIIGLADAAVREARERVRAAILNSGYEFPGRRITANLAPADIPKAGPGLDLALACAILAASGQTSGERLASHALFGELALDGEIRPSRGALAVAMAAAQAGLARLVLARSQARRAALVQEIEVAPAASLTSALRILAGGAPDRAPAVGANRQAPPDADGAPAGPDLREVKGQHHAVQALILAAAGAHNLLLSGPPGTGKTMLAHRLAPMLPPLGAQEAIEVTRIRALAGLGERLVRERPFRAPHHSISIAGLVGGAQRSWVGEVALAHHGVLFLDELSEFARPALEALRQPLEEGRLAIVRAHGAALYPARFMLVAATNPCPCGYAGDGERCDCGEAELARHRRRLSGPLLDRIDLLVHLHRERDLRTAALTTTRRARERVLLARERQAARLAGEGVLVNAAMDAAALCRHVSLDERGDDLLRRAAAQGMLSARGQHRVLRVARTIADLEGSARVRAAHLGAALAMRPEVGLHGSRAA